MLRDKIADCERGEKVFEELSKSHVDVIAPQDGRGVGKNALFWPWQKNLEVKSLDRLLAGYPKVDGDKPFSQQFVTSIEDIFARLKKKAAHLLLGRADAPDPL